MKGADRTQMRRHEIGFVSQRFNPLPTLVAFGNIALASRSMATVSIHIAIINEPETVLGTLRKRNEDLAQTVVTITHYPEAAAYTDRVVHIWHGVIVYNMPADRCL